MPRRQTGGFFVGRPICEQRRTKSKTVYLYLTKAKLAKLAAQSGFREVCDGDGKFCTGPGVFVREIPLKDSGRLYVLVSESGADEAVTLADEKTGARHSILVSAQRSVMIATDGKKIIASYGA